VITIRHRRTGEPLHVLRNAETLRGADLRRAQLAGADLRSADLRGAYLPNADLGDADLRGAGYLPEGEVLREAHVLDADFRGALYDAATRWPRYFRPRWNGCIRLSSPGEVTPAAKPDGDRKEVSS
jgi:Pentapeptide repeats (8 copies)